MADRYWVGGTGNWDTISTANWSTTPGGASGASVPTLVDSVFFDQAGTYTVTMTGALNCLDITVSAGVVSFVTGTSPTLGVYGSMSLLAGTVWSSTGQISFRSTTTGKTITTNGTTLDCPVSMLGIGGGWTLGSALTLGSARVFTSNAGAFNTGGYNLSCGAFSSNGATVRSITLNSSTITYGVGLTGNVLTIVGTNLTLNAGTSTFTNTGGGATLNLGGFTYYNFSFPASVSSITFSDGNNTFNNVSFAGPSGSPGARLVAFGGSQTFNGTVSTNSTTGTQRLVFCSTTATAQRTLTFNSTPSLTDVNFQDIIIRGTATPISGTRIGNQGGCLGITFSTPKNVYWTGGTGDWWYTARWVLSSGDTSWTENNAPLPQDTVIFDNAGMTTSSTIQISSVVNVVYPGIDMSSRTNAMTFSLGTNISVYGDWKNGSGITFSGTSTVITFAGRKTQTITSNGKAFLNAITVDSIGGTVVLADAISIGISYFNYVNFSVNRGTFDTAGYNVTAFSLYSLATSARAIKFRASTVTVNYLDFNRNGNLSFDPGTSNLIFNHASAPTLFSNGAGTAPGGGTFYNITFTAPSLAIVNYTPILGRGDIICNNLTVTALTGSGGTGSMVRVILEGNVTINGTLTCSGVSALHRVMFCAGVFGAVGIGTRRTLSVNAFSASPSDIDFRDIALTGAAINTSITRGGDCGNNTGITFPAPKTVYRSGPSADVHWGANAWATSSGGSPSVNNFPLAQDTAIIDNTQVSTTGYLTLEGVTWNLGTVNFSARTSAMTVYGSSGSFFIYGDWTWGTGVTVGGSSSRYYVFVKNGTQTITCNGVAFEANIQIANPFGTVQLADALTLPFTDLTLAEGTFNAVSYNVTVYAITNSNSSNTLRMGSGTWTITGSSSTAWYMNPDPRLYVGTANIVMTGNTRGFVSPSGHYNKLTIGGSGGTNTTTTIQGGSFSELASTRTDAHTLSLNNTITTSKWSITGTVGNVVTLSPFSLNYSIRIDGPATTGIDYLSITSCTWSTSSAGEFYVGANSTNVSGNVGVIFTAPPTPRTLYWVGGSGNWSSTTKWSLSSGGSSGESPPTSRDSVIFNSASNATAYTVTQDVIARCAAFTMAGPASGNVTHAGTLAMYVLGSITLSATGITRNYSGTTTLSGDSSYTLTTNGVSFSGAIILNGHAATWTLGSNFGSSNNLTFTRGTFNTSASGNYSMSGLTLTLTANTPKTLTLNASTVTLGLTTPFTGTDRNTTFNSGTSTIACTSSGSDLTFSGDGLTFYNVTFNGGTSLPSIALVGAMTFNNFTLTSRSADGITLLTLSGNITINGTLSASGSAPTRRNFFLSTTSGTQRTLSVNAFSASPSDIDFRDITLTGTAINTSITRGGDCKGNSGIVFPAAKTVYWNLAGTNNWSATGWASSSGGTPAVNNFPLAQDTVIIDNSSAGSTINIIYGWNVGTFNALSRTSAISINNSSGNINVYGDWSFGTGTSFSSTLAVFFGNRNVTQTIVSNGKAFGGITSTDSQAIISFGDSTTVGTLTSNGRVYGAGYNISASSLGSILLYNIADLGTGTWTTRTWTSNNTVIANTSTIIIGNGFGTYTFNGNGQTYNRVVLGNSTTETSATTTISGNNTFAELSSARTKAHTVAFGATNQRIGLWGITGTWTGNIVTITGSTATSYYTGSAAINPNFINVQGIFLSANGATTGDVWYAGANSTNSDTYNMTYTANPSVPVAPANATKPFFMMFT